MIYRKRATKLFSELALSPVEIESSEVNLEKARAGFAKLSASTNALQNPHFKNLAQTHG